MNSRGWCGRHYTRWRKYGNPEHSVPARATVHEASKPVQRFLLYGLTEEEHEALWAQQDGQCAICRKVLFRTGPRSANIDHDHQTGEVRGILCRACNYGLGLLGDDLEHVQRAAEYLAAKRRAEV